MKLNEINLEREEEEEEEEENEEKENVEQKAKNVTKQKKEKKEKEENEDNEENENEENEKNEENENEENEKNEENENEENEKNEEKENEENEYEEKEEEENDNNKNKMINSEEGASKEGKKQFKKKSFICIIIPIILIVGVLLMILIIILSMISNSKKNKSLFSLTNSILGKKNNLYQDELNTLYNFEGKVNVMRFINEKVNNNSNSYSSSSSFSSTSSNSSSSSTSGDIHINLGFCEKNINNVLNHLGSVLYKAEKSNTFLHIHMMNADTLNYDTVLKLKNMIYKINNNTEIIVYNASQALKDFKIREGYTSKFSNDYAKLYAFKVLHKIPKILFLDIENIMVQKDLSELFNKDMNDVYGRGISDYPSLKNPSSSFEWLDKFLFDKSEYINGGVILVNLELCQKDDFYNKAVELNNGQDFYTKTEEPAQDILNILMKRKIEFFHPKFNKINYYENPEDKSDETKWYPWVSEFMKLSEKNNHFYTKQELIEADQDPVIINYSFDKQLNKESKKYREDISFYSNLLKDSSSSS